MRSPAWAFVVVAATLLASHPRSRRRRGRARLADQLAPRRDARLRRRPRSGGRPARAVAGAGAGRCGGGVARSSQGAHGSGLPRRDGDDDRPLRRRRARARPRASSRRTARCCAIVATRRSASAATARRGGSTSPRRSSPATSATGATPAGRCCASSTTRAGAAARAASSASRRRRRWRGTTSSLPPRSRTAATWRRTTTSITSTAAAARSRSAPAGEGYPWRVIGENIAAGLGSPQQVVAGWLASPGHCANILSPDFAEMSAAYAINDEAAMEIYWTQVFGRR